MTIHVVINLLILIGILILGTVGQRMLGTGKWSVLNIQECENDAEMPWRARVRRHKVNRTHDAFDADVSVLAEIDDSYGIRIEVCKRMDGGCKYFMTLDDESLPAFFKKYMPDNLRRALEAAGIDPPDFPVPQGEYHVENFVLDTSNLSKEGIYGDYISNTFIVKEKRDLICVQTSVKYEPSDELGGMPKA